MREAVVLKVRRQAQHLRIKHYDTFRESPFALLLSQPRFGNGLGGVIIYQDKFLIPPHRFDDY